MATNTQTANNSNSKSLTPQQRALLFAQATRQYLQPLPAMNFADGQTVRVQLPKIRFLSKIYLEVKGSFKATHASKTSFTKSVFEKYNLIKQIRLNMNSGFNPYVISGSMLKFYNSMNSFKNSGLADPYSIEKLDNTVSAAGTTDSVKFFVELPITLNERDPIGLILLQNEQTIVTLEVDCGNLASIMSDTDITLSEESLTITPIIETFSIPTLKEAIPDYSILKLVNEQKVNINTYPGDVIIPLQTGLTYRKILFYLSSDAAGTPIDPSLINNVQLIFNQADTPYNIPLDVLEYINKKDYQGALPQGCYAFDFSTQGIANLGGGRDYIDTERLTEFWLKFNFGTLTGSSNNITIVSEKLAKLS